MRKCLLRFLSVRIDGLQPKTGKGRKRKLSSEREEEFREQVEQLQRSLEERRVRGQNVQVLLKEKFCVDHSLPSVYHALKRCGLSSISPRSKHPKSSHEAQENFKKIPRKSS